jgi:hypothetical protein
LWVRSYLVCPHLAIPYSEKPAQINKDKTITDEINTEQSNTDSFFSDAGHSAPEAKGIEAAAREREYFCWERVG